MVAKRNDEVGKLSELAREVMRQQGRVEVGGVAFTAGDRVITRINDHRSQIYNREGWRAADVAPGVRAGGLGRRRHRQAGVSMARA